MASNELDGIEEFLQHHIAEFMAIPCNERMVKFAQYAQEVAEDQKENAAPGVLETTLPAYLIVLYTRLADATEQEIRNCTARDATAR